VREHKTASGNRLVAFQCEVRQSEFVMSDLPITCISSANQQHVQLIIVVVSTVKLPELNLSKKKRPVLGTRSLRSDV